MSLVLTPEGGGATVPDSSDRMSQKEWADHRTDRSIVVSLRDLASSCRSTLM